MFIAKKSSFVFALALLLASASCGGGGGGANSSPWVGTWLLQSTNGADMSALNLIYTWTESTLHVDAKAYNCTIENDFWSDGKEFLSTVTGGDCPGTVAGAVSSGTISFGEKTMTIHQTEYRGNALSVEDVFTQL